MGKLSVLAAVVVVLCSLSHAVDAETTLVLMTKRLEPYIEQAMESFEATHTDVKVQFLAGSLDKIRVVSAAGTAVDVFGVDLSWVRTVIEDNLLMDVTTQAQRASQQLNQIAAPGREAFTAAGRLYGLPSEFGAPIGLYYNMDVFSERGVAPPTGEWSWLDLRDAARKLSCDRDGDGQNDLWGFFATYAHWIWMPYYWTRGADVLAPDGRRATGYLDTAVSRGALQWWADLTLVDRVSPKSNDSYGTSFWTARNLAMEINGYWNRPRLTEVADSPRPMIARLPHWDGNRQNVLYGWGFGASRTSRQPELAWEFVKYMASEEVQYNVAKEGKVLSPNLNALKRVANQDPLLYPFLLDLGTSRPEWGTRLTYWNDVRPYLDSIVRRTLGGEALAGILEDTARQVDGVIAQALATTKK